MNTFKSVTRALVSVVKNLRPGRNNHINKWHVFQPRPNHCVVGCLQSLHLYLTGKKLSTKVAVEVLESQGDKTLAEEGTTLEAAVKGLRKMRVKFKSRRIGKIKTTISFMGRMVLTSDEESYVEIHAVLLYRQDGTIWLFDCLQPTGAYEITEEHAVRLINKSDETFRIEKV